LTFVVAPTQRLPESLTLAADGPGFAGI